MAQSEEVTVIHNPEEKRFETTVDGMLCELTYNIKRDTIYLLHTGVPKELSGRGIANVLARTGLEYARDNDLLVAVYCPFVAVYIKRHPEWKKLLKPGASWKKLKLDED